MLVTKETQVICRYGSYNIDGNGDSIDYKHVSTMLVMKRRSEPEKSDSYTELVEGKGFRKGTRRKGQAFSDCVNTHRYARRFRASRLFDRSDTPRSCSESMDSAPFSRKPCPVPMNTHHKSGFIDATHIHKTFRSDQTGRISSVMIERCQLGKCALAAVFVSDRTGTCISSFCRPSARQTMNPSRKL